GLVTKYESWEFLGAIIDDDGVGRGIVAQDVQSHEIKSFPSDATILATGGPGIIFGKSTNSMINTGSAASILYQQGAKYANGEFIQIHPTAIPGDDKLRLMSESARGEGGRIWTYKDGEPWYFLEEKYPAYGNLVPRDIATREIFDVCVNQKLGINGENMVYLDLSHKDPKELDVKLGGIIEIYEKFVGEDPRKVPMKIFPAVHYSMGGLWVDYDQMTSIPGIFAAGECDYSQHGGNRLGANSLLSAIYGGSVAGPKAIEYIAGLDKQVEELPSELFEGREKVEQEKFEDLMRSEERRVGREGGERRAQEHGGARKQSGTGRERGVWLMAFLFSGRRRHTRSKRDWSSDVCSSDLSLLSAIYGGSVAGPKAIEYIDGLDKHVEDLPSELFEGREKVEQEKFEDLMKMEGSENAYQIHQELGEWMTDNVTVVRDNEKLLKTDEKIKELLERWDNISINDTSSWSNQGVMFTRQLKNMLHLARVITIGAYNRNESRGAHYKPEFPDRNDEEWLKTTVATFNEETDEPEFTYEDVDVSLIEPRARDYTKKH